MTTDSILHVSIEPNAIVAQSSNIGLQEMSPSSKKLSSNDDASDETTKTQKYGKINIVITGGNVFQPGSELLVIPRSDSDNSLDSENREIQIRLGENNLFDEGSKVILDMNACVDKEIHIGSYNHFGPKSCIRTGAVGNGNIFHPLCSIITPSIESGNVIMPKVKIEWNNGIRFHEKIFFELDDGRKFSGDSNLVKGKSSATQIRNNFSGTKQNVKEVGFILSSSRKTVLKFHKTVSSNQIKN
mmetsp:Transcript_17770/g.25093  ORF Transcript_17770/g.25093 Transcript_17770/m.25093 type:complete len:243 (-) Transcript_17770:71-799(-)